MIETAIALLIIVLLPFSIIWALIRWWGKRHGWGIEPYAWMMIIVGLGGGTIFNIFVLKAPLSSVVRIIAILIVPCIIYARGMIYASRAMQKKRNDSKNSVTSPNKGVEQETHS